MRRESSCLFSHIVSHYCDISTLRCQYPTTRSPPYTLAVRLPLQPQGGSTTAVVESLIWGIVLHIWLPGAGHHGRVRVHIVLLLGLIALKLKYDFLACLQVSGPPLVTVQVVKTGITPPLATSGRFWGA